MIKNCRVPQSQGRERWTADERILGGSAFVERLLREVREGAAARGRRRTLPLAELVRRVCAAVGLPPAALPGGGRRPAVSRAREGIAYLWLEVLGRSGRSLVPALGVGPASVYKATYRGRAAAAHWRAIRVEP